MFKKLFLCLLSVAFMFTAESCFAAKKQNKVVRTETWQPKITLPGAVVVCRSKQCAPAEISMSREYIYNSLTHLLDNNSQSKMLPCMADAKTHVCTEEYIALPIKVGVTPAHMFIDDIKITDFSISVGRKTLDLILNYNVSFNGQTPVCKPAQTLVYVKNTENVIMEDAGYTCKMTTIGNSTIKTLFAIDYIDLDYGYIGGYYSIGVSGPAFGGGSGYMLLRLPKDAYPLAPELMAPVEETPQENTPKEEDPVDSDNQNEVDLLPMMTPDSQVEYVPVAYETAPVQVQEQYPIQTLPLPPYAVQVPLAQPLPPVPVQSEYVIQTLPMPQGAMAPIPVPQPLPMTQPDPAYMPQTLPMPQEAMAPIPVPQPLPVAQPDSAYVPQTLPMPQEAMAPIPLPQQTQPEQAVPPATETQPVTTDVLPQQPATETVTKEIKEKPQKQPSTVQVFPLTTRKPRASK